MRVCFLVQNLTSLRYFAPIIELIRDEPDLEIIFGVVRHGIKYNRLTTDKNYNIFRKIKSSIVPKAKIIFYKDSKIKCDVLFTCEGADLNSFDFKRHYAIQHSFDYIISGRRASSKTIYLVNSEVYGLDFQKRHKTEYIIPPVPVAFSNINRQIDFAKNHINTSKEIVFIFFPEEGSIRLVRSIISYLKKKDYYVIIKQRRKNQLVPKKMGMDLIVYDDIWYPSEAIFYPIIAKCVIGFGTSAYTDICEVGINFIDNAVPKYSRKGGFEMIHMNKRYNIEYLKPNLENLWYIDKKFFKKTKNIIDHISYRNFSIKNIPDNILKKFYLNLLKY